MRLHVIAERCQIGLIDIETLFLRKATSSSSLPNCFLTAELRRIVGGGLHGGLLLGRHAVADRLEMAM